MSPNEKGETVTGGAGPWKHIRIALLLAILAGAAALRTSDFTSLWKSDYRGWSGSFYGNIARNYLKFGYVTTRLGAVRNVLPKSQDEFEYYVNHPPLLGILLSFSFRVFGDIEWAARLVPLLASLATLLLLFLIVRKLWGEEAAFCATIVCAILPMGAFYGDLADVQGPVVLFFCVFTIYFYLRFRDAPSGLNTGLMLGCFVLGALTDWPAYYLVPLLVLHYIIWKPRGAARSRKIWLLAAIGPALLVGYLLYANWLEGGGLLDFSRMIDRFLYRSMERRVDLPGSPEFTTGEWLDKIFMGWWPEYFTIPALIMLIAWIGVSVYRLCAGKARAADGFFLVFLLFGLIHVFLFRQGAFVHDYWSYYMFVPTGLAAGLAISSATKALFPGIIAVRIALGVAVLAVIGIFGGITLSDLRKADADVSDAETAQVIDAILGDSSSMVTDMYGMDSLNFYVRSPIVYAPMSPANIFTIAQSSKIEYIFLHHRNPQYRYLKRQLEWKWDYLLGQGVIISVKSLRRILKERPLVPRVQPPDVAVEEHEWGMRLTWRHPNPQSVKRFMLYWRSPDKDYYKDFMDLGRKTEFDFGLKRDRPLIVVITAVNHREEESLFTREIRWP